ncbi:MAG TPA: type VI secretion system lipoprotein TssJ [Geminicoccaceae bacterium]|nr:type VI secretion system lipoprotein TssJ [Geminicoccaceae bacterium]
MRRRPFLALALLLAACGGNLLLAACGGGEPPPPPPPPTIVSLTLKADPDVNPDQGGAPKPIAVKVFELASPASFMSADFFTLDADAEGTLGGDLVGQESFVLAPGGTEVFQRELKPITRFIGLAASYAQIDRAGWRAVIEPPQQQTSLLEGRLGARGLTLRTASP